MTLLRPSVATRRRRRVHSTIHMVQPMGTFSVAQRVHFPAPFRSSPIHEHDRHAGTRLAQKYFSRSLCHCIDENNTKRTSQSTRAAALCFVFMHSSVREIDSASATRHADTNIFHGIVASLLSKYIEYWRVLIALP